jgi:hypothetical protein
VKHTSEGSLDFWERPLTANSSIADGSIFINQQEFSSVANVSAPLESSNLVLPPGDNVINYSGTRFNGIIELYRLSPTTFCNNISSFSIGWINGSIYAPGVKEGPVGPSGLYDYYNGLAYEMSIPQYPIEQTICVNDHGSPQNCELASVSTTLGQFFNSDTGIFILSATNIPLTANQQSNSTSSSQSKSGALSPSLPHIFFFMTGTTFFESLNLRSKRPCRPNRKYQLIVCLSLVSFIPTTTACDIPTYPRR